MSTLFKGGCACGALRYEIAGEPVFQNHCQCFHCQKVSGTGHGSYLSFMERSDAKITGKATEWSVAADSGNDKAYAFCPTCGSPVYITFSAMPDLIAIAAASLDDPGQFRPEALTYSIRGHAWDSIDPELQHFERMPG